MGFKFFFTNCVATVSELTQTVPPTFYVFCSFFRSTDLAECGGTVKNAFEEFKEKTGRSIKLEIEPGTFLTANNGALVSRVQDIVETDDYKFYKLDSGMTDVLRPSLYGAIHPCTILPTSEEGRGTEEVVIVGHCCESGDLMTPLPGDPEALGKREVTKAQVGDYCVIDGSGAYCSGMSCKNYNSFPEAAEVMVWEGGAEVIRKRQSVEQIWENEL